MKLKKRLALLLVAVMITTLMPTIGFAEDMAASDSSKTAPVFSDMPNNWSTEALQNAVDNGLLKGDNGRLRPGDSLTRAEMASIINRAFGATAEASLTGYQDVPEKSWYYEEMAKALQMGTFQGGGDGLLRPQDPITRQEVFAVMARAFKLSNGSDAHLNGFADQASISSWAKSAAAALIDAGYIQGSNGRLNPKENITRAEFAKIMDSMVTGYVNSPGIIDEVPGGNIMINVPGVTLKNLAVKGDLIIGDGVGEGNVSLENVTIAARLVVRGGGENSILITGNSNVDSIIIAKVKGKVRVFTADGTEIGEVLTDGSDDVILEGNFSSITILSNNIVVNAVNAEIGEASIEGNNSTLLVGSGSSVETVRVTGNNVTVEGSGDVDTVKVYSANVVVKTMNTAVTAEIGSAGVDAAGTSVGTGNTVTTRPPATSGGSGGSSAPPPPPSDFAGGAGTEASPYQVATADQLNKVRNHLDKHFIQTADINLGVEPWNQGAGWVPIGDYVNGASFRGIYDGGNNRIIGLFINRPEKDGVGLFGETSHGAVVKNLKMINVDVTGRDYVGAVSGGWGGYVSLVDSTLINVHVSGSVKGRQYVGGLIGTNSTIRQSSSAANVHGGDVGGLAGMLTRYGNVIEQSYATGEITGLVTGGLIGHNNYGRIINSYSLAQVKGTGPNNGGVIGQGYHFEPVLTNVFAAGVVDSGGGLIGVNHNGGTDYEVSSFWDKEATGKTTSANSNPSFGKTTADMIKRLTFIGWDFDTIWNIDEGSTYPYLRNNMQDPKPAPETAAVTGVAIQDGNRRIVENETVQLTASISPTNATNKVLTWESSDSDIATVNGTGLVTGISEGTAIITVRTTDGNFTDTVTITVKNYLYDFDSNNGGFTVSGTPGTVWQWGEPVTWPGSAKVGLKCWGTNLTGNHSNSMNETLKSPPIDMSSYSAGDIVEIKWWQALHMESSGFDQVFAEIYKPDSTTAEMWKHAESSTQSDWQEKTYEMTIPEGGIDWIQLQFRVVTDFAINYSGYYIDGITVLKLQ